MPEPVRVKDNVTGHEYSTYGVYEGLTVLDVPAVDDRGDLLPPTYPEAPATPATPATTTGRTATTKES
jgi:hypothetical protein